MNWHNNVNSGSKVVAFHIVVNVWIQGQIFLVELGNQLLFSTAATIFCYPALQSNRTTVLVLIFSSLGFLF